jgi:dolichol-phosphate mannosyltransferase
VRLLVVTPAHNEEDNIRDLHASLQSQSFTDFHWVVVNDGSSDATGRVLDEIAAEPIPDVVERENGGGLIGGSAYSAWRFGIAQVDDLAAEYTHVMKLDADVRLPPTYFETVLAASSPIVGIMGGVIASQRMREQVHHVPGPVKIYTVDAYLSLGDLPSAIGFDVMDEVAASLAGFETRVVPEARFALARAIGASEGGIHGRFRNGRMCRWTGYWFPYFLLHALRYVARRPYVLGAVAMLIGYARATASPYSEALRNEHRALQVRKLRDASRNPVAWVNRTYRY